MQGIEAVELDGNVRLTLAIDGADEVDPQLGLIKGGGAALLREKIVVTAAERFLVVAETRKRVSRLGETFKLPVEVVRFGWADTRRRLPEDADPARLGDALKATVGVVEHGLFIGLADEALLGKPDGQVEVMTRP